MWMHKNLSFHFEKSLYLQEKLANVTQALHQDLNICRQMAKKKKKKGGSQYEFSATLSNFQNSLIILEILVASLVC